jgi:hypothetical protein
LDHKLSPSWSGDCATSYIHSSKTEQVEDIVDLGSIGGRPEEEPTPALLLAFAWGVARPGPGISIALPVHSEVYHRH